MAISKTPNNRYFYKSIAELVISAVLTVAIVPRLEIEEIKKQHPLSS